MAWHLSTSFRAAPAFATPAPPMHVYANPASILKIARPLTPFLCWSGAALIAAALYWGLFVAPPEQLQGESVRIIYLHVPAVWLGLVGWCVFAVVCLLLLVWCL